MEITAEMKANAVETMQAAQAIVDKIDTASPLWDLAIEARNSACETLLAVCGYEWAKVA
jgi:hypothetical protein